MIPQPLHPAVVHFPIVFVVLLPLVVLAALVLIRRGESPLRAWVPAVAIAIALAGSAWIAVQTGEEEEDAVEDIVAESAIHEHEEAAGLFLPLSLGMLALMGVGLVRGRPGHLARHVALLAAAFLAFAGYRVGHTGGELVYEHGAAAAYSAGPGGSQREDGSERNHDDREESSREGTRGGG